MITAAGRWVVVRGGSAVGSSSVPCVSYAGDRSDSAWLARRIPLLPSLTGFPAAVGRVAAGCGEGERRGLSAAGRRLGRGADILPSHPGRSQASVKSCQVAPQAPRFLQCATTPLRSRSFSSASTASCRVAMIASLHSLLIHVGSGTLTISYSSDTLWELKLLRLRRFLAQWARMSLMCRCHGIDSL